VKFVLLRVLQSAHAFRSVQIRFGAEIKEKFAPFVPLGACAAATDTASDILCWRLMKERRRQHTKNVSRTFRIHSCDLRATPLHPSPTCATSAQIVSRTSR
jgi:hypothetical protein